MSYFDTQYETMKGYVEDIVFRNVDNGYCVIYVNADDVLQCAVGVFPPIEVGEYLEMHGNFTVNSKFGEQFNVKECKIIKPTDKEASLSVGLIILHSLTLNCSPNLELTVKLPCISRYSPTSIGGKTPTAHCSTSSALTYITQ